jgi:hypothetical protein
MRPNVVKRWPNFGKVKSIFLEKIMYFLEEQTPDDTFVYGQIGDSPVLVPLLIALELALTYRAISTAKTYEQFRGQVSGSRWRWVEAAIASTGGFDVSDVRNRADHLLPLGQRLPIAADVFDSDSFFRLTGNDELHLGWLEQGMLEWLPPEFVAKYGTLDSGFDGECLALPLDKVPEMTKWLKGNGHRVIPAQWLIELANGD